MCHSPNRFVKIKNKTKRTSKNTFEVPSKKFRQLTLSHLLQTKTKIHQLTIRLFPILSKVHQTILLSKFCVQEASRVVDLQKEIKLKR